MEETILKCKKCGSGDLRRSQCKNILDELRVALSRHPIRCRACGARFFVGREKFALIKHR